MVKVFSAAEAARETGVSRTKIQRMLGDGRFPQAAKTAAGWRIPLDDLLACGLTPGLYSPGRETVREHVQVMDSDMTELTHQVELLRVQLLAARTLADERSRTIEQMSITMRALEAARPEQGTAEGPITKIARRFRL